MIDFREHDQREHGPTLDERLQHPIFDLQHAQRVRERMRAQGMRVPLTEADEFAEADRRMGVRS